MKRSLIRAAVVGFALAAIAAAGASPALAADPAPTLGGGLAVTPTEVTVLSNGNVPAHVILTTDVPGAVFTPASFDIMPGEVVHVAVSGTPTGVVSAAFSQLGRPATGESAGVVLQAPFVKTPQPLSLVPFGLAALALVVGLGAAIAVLRRTRPWELRVTRA